MLACQAHCAVLDGMRRRFSITSGFLDEQPPVTAPRHSPPHIPGSQVHGAGRCSRDWRLIVPVIVVVIVMHSRCIAVRHLPAPLKSASTTLA